MFRLIKSERMFGFFVIFDSVNNCNLKLNLI